MCTSRVSPSTSPSPSTSSSPSTTSSSSWLWLLVTTFVTLLRLLDGFWQMGYWFLIYRTHSSRFASVPFRTLPQLFITLISCKPPNTPLCEGWPRSHLCDWQSLIFALKLKKFHHFSICCCRTCKRNSRSPPSNSLSNSLIKHTDFLFTPAPLSHRHPLAVSLERGVGAVV